MFAIEDPGVGGSGALTGRTFMSTVRKWNKGSRAVAGRTGYRGGVNAINGRDDVE